MRTPVIWIATMLLAGASLAQQSAPQAPRAEGHQPPAQAYADCKGKQAGDTVQHQTPQGVVPAVCEQTPQGLVARPARKAGEPRTERNRPAQPARATQAGRYSIEQAISGQAQLHTIAFSGLAFLTGDFAHDTFLPPVKVSDYFGFQYMRDIDANGGGHNTSFLTTIALNMIAILDDRQQAQLVALARAQQGDIREFALRRFPLMQAFRRNLSGDLPAGTKGLSRDAIVRYSADLYELDGRLAYEQAQVMAQVLRSLSPAQRAAIAMLQFGDSRTWPKTQQRSLRGLPHEVDVAVMTYASEMFSWYAGSIEADTYFCPERHGMYFGGFGMKTAPAMGKQDYSISTSLTGDSGETFLSVLNESQRRQILSIIDQQRAKLEEIVRIRGAIAIVLRLFLNGTTADNKKMLSLARRYGELDGELSYSYASAFASVGQSLSAGQKAKLTAMRSDNPQDPQGPFLYSAPIQAPAIINTDTFFGASR